MIRRKLMLTLGSLILMMVGAAIWAIVLYESAVADLSETGATLLQRTEAIAGIEEALGALESRLVAFRNDPANAPGDLAEAVGALSQRIGQLPRPPAGESEGDTAELLHAIAVDVAAVGTAGDPHAAGDAATRALQATVTLRQHLDRLSNTTQEHFGSEYDRLVVRLRWWTLGLALAFLVVINVSIAMIIRAAATILRPLDQLVEASRHLAREEFDYRVEVDSSDEFAELAQATNRMAQQLHTNEQRRLEFLQQVARTMSHEINNAIAIIDLQLRLAARSSGALADSGSEVYLRQIHETLRKMSETVASLSRIRRVVLTEYVGDAKMVDLRRSTEDEVVEGTAGEAGEARSSS
jgi:HAMP domain-containing protein